MDRHLTFKELANLTDFFNLHLTPERIVPVKLMPERFLNVDGFRIIGWNNQVNYLSPDSRNPIISLYPGVFPVEEIGPRLRVERLRRSRSEIYSGIPVRRDLSLVRQENGNYRLSPQEEAGCMSYYYPGSADYAEMATRLNQMELRFVI